jgi:uncharacterized membrane protein YfcA
VSKSKESAFLCIGGLCAGFINGLLGTGGGILLVFLLGKMMKEKADGDGKDVFATTLTATAVMSVVSLFIYSKKGGVSLDKNLIQYIIGAVTGGFFGAVLLDKIRVRTAKIVFCVLLIFAGANMAGVIG